MTKTFKQQVEEIQNTSELTISSELSKSGWCAGKGNCKKYHNCTNCINMWKVARILTAHNAELDRIAGKVKKLKIKGNENHPAVEGFNDAVTQCQAYIQAQKGS